MNIWAHRGCSYRYPENTLSAFRAACEYEITGIELDIQLSKDGHIVVIHDETVNRTTNGMGSVQDMTLRQLKSLKIIPNKDTGLTHETIPTMREVLELMAPECRERGLLINIELKNSVVRYEGMEKKILALVKEFELEPYIVYSSFNPDSLKVLKELKPDVRTGTLNSFLSNCYHISEEIEVDALHPNIRNMDMENIRELTTLPIRAYNSEPFFPSTAEITLWNAETEAAKGITDIFTNEPGNYVPKRLVKTSHAITLNLAKQINPVSGFVEAADENRCATEHFYFAKAGTILKWKTQKYCYQVYCYSMETEARLIYSYCYQEEENWATYVSDKSCIEWSCADTVFSQNCYFRLAVKCVNDAFMTEAPKIEECMELLSTMDVPYVWSSYFQAEAQLTVESVKKQRKKSDLIFILLTDSHYVNNGTWQDTAYNIEKVAKQIKPDGVIHLGDFTDGMLSLDTLKEYSGNIINDLKQTGAPVYLCLGNHDSNYFRNNPQKMTEQEMSHYYLNQDKPYYYVDYKKQKLRMIFLYSFDYREQVRYGFPVEELEWIKEVLQQTQPGWGVLVFSHVPPLPEIHFWSNEIRNGEELMKILETYHKQKGHKILAFIHGHNHAEQVYLNRNFPIISIGCNKLEDFKDRKPEGAYTCDRKRNTVTQDLWDVLIVPRDKKELRFVRFGAGEDRIVEC